MARVNLVNGSGSATVISAGASSFFPPESGDVASNQGTESDGQYTFRVGGTMTNLFVRSVTNASNNVTVFVSRKNNADGNLTITVPASTTGQFEDIVNVDNIASGDTYGIKGSNTGGTNNTYTVVGLTFEADGVITSYTPIAITGSSISTANITRFGKVCGTNYQAATTEDDAEVTFKHAYTAREFQTRVGTNTRASSATTFTTRKNQADGNMTFSVGASATGVFEDASNTDSIAIDDEYNIKIVTGAGSGTLAMRRIGCAYTSTDFAYPLIAGGGLSPATVAASATRNVAPAGNTISTVTENNVGMEPGFNVTLTMLNTKITANTILASSTLKVRDNQANGNNTLSIAASTTGYFEDATPHSDAITKDQKMNYQFVGGAGGTSLAYQYVSCVATATVSSQNLSDSLTITEILSRVITMLRNFGESVSITEIITAHDTFARAILSETISLTDTFSRIWSTSRRPSETVSLTDTFSRIWSLARTNLESVSLTEVLARTWSAIRNQTETITITEIISAAIAGYQIVILNTISLVDSFTRTWTAPRSQSDSLSITDAFTRTWSTSRTSGETITITEVITAFRSVFMSFLESLPITDTFSRIWSTSRRPSDSLPLTEVLTRAWNATKTLTEIQTITESITSRISAFSLIILEALSLTDTLSRAFSATRTFSDQPTVTDALSRAWTAVRSHSETVSLTDTLTALKVRFIELLDTVNLTDTFSRVWSLSARVLSEIIVITDRAAFPLNWTKRTKPTATWTPRADVNASWTPRQRP